MGNYRTGLTIDDIASIRVVWTIRAFIYTMFTRSAQKVTQTKYSIENIKLMIGRHKNRQSK